MVNFVVCIVLDTFKLKEIKFGELKEEFLACLAD